VTVEPEKATSLRRGLDILVALGEQEALDDGGFGVVRLAQFVGSDKSRVSRTLRTLADYDLVDRDPETLAYRFGWRLFALARRFADARLLEAAPTYVALLVREFEEAAHLSVPSGPGVLTVLSQAPSRAVQAAGVVGSMGPLHCTSAGRAVLLDHDRGALERVLGSAALERPGPNAPRDLDDLLARIAVARRDGFAIVDEESEAGLVAAAAPVRDFSGRIVAALNISAPKFRFADQLAAAGARVKAVADELSESQGWQLQPRQGAV
jgi:DNA-binding IclR family transcriptional regulator